MGNGVGLLTIFVGVDGEMESLSELVFWVSIGDQEVVHLSFFIKKGGLSGTCQDFEIGGLEVDKKLPSEIYQYGIWKFQARFLKSNC